MGSRALLHPLTSGLATPGESGDDCWLNQYVLVEIVAMVPCSTRPVACLAPGSRVGCCVENQVLAGDSRGARRPSLARSLRARRCRLDGAMYEFGCCRVSSQATVCCGVWPCGRCVADGSQAVL